MAAIKRVTSVQLAVWLCALFIASTQRRDFVQLDGSGQVDQDHTANKLVTRQLSSRDSTYDRRQAQKPARFIMGIFTVVTDIKRRKLIRKSLAMYKDRRICSMGSNNGELPPAIADHCELIYTFVVGANRDGPTQVLGNFSGPLLTTPPQDFIFSQEPNDITFLNIKVSQPVPTNDIEICSHGWITFDGLQENMEEGKSSTWFNYATIIMNANDIDYAIKCDSDTYVRVDKFFNVSTEHLPRGASRTYAGKTTWSFHRNHAYMEGQFYVVSVPCFGSCLKARYISTQSW